MTLDCFSRCWRAAIGIFIAGVIICAPFALAGGVLKIDQQAISGEILSFDGREILIQTGVVDGRPVQEKVALSDTIRVRLAGGSAVTASPRVTPVAQPPSTPGARVGRGGGAPGAPVNVPISGTARGVAVPMVPAPPPLGPIVLPAGWHLRSSSGDFLEGRIRAWTQQQVSFEFAQSVPTLELPTTRITELWRAAPDLVRKAHDLKAGSDSEDVAYVIRDREIIAVKGVALGIEGESFKFRYEGEDRKINMTRLLGVVLVPQKANPADAAASAFYQSALLTNGRLLGHWQKLENGLITFQTLLGPALRLPASSVISMENRNGRLVYLSDLKPIKVEQTPYFDRVMPYRNDISLSGGPLKMLSGEFEHGIAVHSRCVLEYDIDGAFEEFHTALGFEHPQGQAGRATIRVLTDGRTSYEKLDFRGDEPPVELAANVRGVKRLTLVVDFGLNEDVGDRVIWGTARLTRAEVGK